MEANTNPPKRRFQFTLLNLILLMSMVAFGFGLYRARLNNEILDAKNQELSARNQSLFENNKQLRSERGELTVEDETKVYAIRVPELRDNVWTYRIYLPEGDNYFVSVVVNNLPTGEYKPIRIQKVPPDTITIKSIYVDNSQGVATGIESGEHLITFAFFKKEGKWNYRLHANRVTKGNQIGPRTGGEILSKEDEWPAADDFIASSVGGIAIEQKETELRSPCILLDYRRGKTRAGPSSTCGAIVWIDRISNYKE